MRRRRPRCARRGKRQARRGLGERVGVSRPVRRAPFDQPECSLPLFPTPRTVRRQRRVARARPEPLPPAATRRCGRYTHSSVPAQHATSAPLHRNASATSVGGAGRALLKDGPQQRCATAWKPRQHALRSIWAVFATRLRAGLTSELRRARGGAGEAVRQRRGRQRRARARRGRLQQLRRLLLRRRAQRRQRRRRRPRRERRGARAAAAKRRRCARQR